MTRDEIKQYIIQKSREQGVDPALALAVARQESGYNPSATSPVGAGGVFQLMPATGKEMGVKNIYDPVDNINGGLGYLNKMLSMFGGNKDMALAAYNAGPGAVKKYGGVPPYKETQNYVKSINSSLPLMVDAASWTHPQAAAPVPVANQNPISSLFGGLFKGPLEAGTNFFNKLDKKLKWSDNG